MPNGADGEIFKYLTSLGVGGAVAALMFVFYRKDIKQYTELWKTATDQLMLIVRENTASSTKLITMLENIERNAMRKSDIEVMVSQMLGERKL